MDTSHKVELTILMPCLNEARTLPICIEKAHTFIRNTHIQAEILVADNGSTDDSQNIAQSLGAKVVDVKEKGYGAALLGGIDAAQGRYIIMADADDSYDFLNLEPFVEKLREGYELVIGNRFAGGIAPGAMPPLHRYLGNPVLSKVGRLFFRSPVRDFHCGLRGFSREAVHRLNLQATGMEFASEMIVKAVFQDLRIAEVPTTLSPDGRDRPPHLRTWHDGWRHLRFLLLYSPRWLFVYPGLFLLLLGIAAMVWLLPGPRHLGSIEFDVNTLLYAAVATIVGLQVLSFGVYSKLYGIQEGFLPPDPKFKRWNALFTLERGIVAGMLFLLVGTIGAAYAVATWESEGFGALVPGTILRLTIPSVTLLAWGIQLLFTSFFWSVLSIKHK